ncbi:MAG TPA: serine hydroxymethyltransferase [Candidatus Paceibacterota bacterium]|nr:serine hydroxymethyltransferase [Candidatus Paceibacterota bacterium]
MSFNHLKKSDPALYSLVKKEILRQAETIDLIPSESIAPLEVLELLGSPLTNKYSEGYPGKRYYPGNIYYDEIEELAQKRALEAFGLKESSFAVNVQPYSGSPANLAIYFALLKPGDKILGMDLASGGHLTHGAPVNLSGKIFHSLSYSVNTDGLIDYDKVEKIALKYRPKIIVCGATSYPRKIDFQKFSFIAKKTNAFLMADISHIIGLIIAKKHPSPFPYADIVMSTTHKTLQGPRGAVIFINKKSQLAKKMKINLEEMINKSVFPGCQGGPHNNVIAAIAYSFKRAKTKEFLSYQNQIVKNAKVLSLALKKKGFQLVTNGTDNHLMVVNLKNLNLSGKEAEKILEQANILANRNVIPGDLKAFNPSGIRIGTPFVSFRGMKEKEMELIADFIDRLLIKKENPWTIKKEVKKLTKQFPLTINN